MVGKVLMDRYIKMQTLHTATLNALTSGDGKVFGVAGLVDQAMVDGDRSSFDKHLAEAVAGVIETLLILMIFYVLHSECASNDCVIKSITMLVVYQLYCWYWMSPFSEKAQPVIRLCRVNSSVERS